ncbi:MAG TPA: YciI family protein [Candidatus Dormibacteraeota bacterium]|jgi:hypothetical protein|nr:YciI family protein [Candidatus Dormibacteraeota bacterium]
MKYMLLFVGTNEHEEKFHNEPDEETTRQYAEAMRWFETNAGCIVGGEQLQPPSTATTVRIDGGRPVVTDGPFLEAKETIGGYAIVDVPDLDAALTLAKAWPASGAVEVRPLVERQG